VIDAFLCDLAARRGEFTADVRSAQTLTSAQERNSLPSKLRELAGGKVHLSMREDKSLIGGMIVKIGSRLIDASVGRGWNVFERQLKSQSLTTQKGAA